MRRAQLLRAGFFRPSYCGFFVCLAAWLAQGQAIISGLSDRGDYSDSVTFSVSTTSGFDSAAVLDGVPIGLGVAHVLTNVNHHELALWGTNQATAAVTNFLIRFNVVASEREGSETGLPPWIPYPPIPSSSAEIAGAHLRLILPSAFPTGLPIPVVAWVENTNGVAVRVNGSLEAPGRPLIPVFRGVGSGFLPGGHSSGLLDYEPRLKQIATARHIALEESTWETIGGGTLGTTNWPEHSRIAITGNVVIPAGAAVTLGAGSVVILSPGVAISVNGRLASHGTEADPVVFCPALPGQPWGGFYLTNSTSVIEATGTIFTGSGADPDAVPNSHRHEQCLFYLDNHARLHLTNSAAISLAGQFGHGTDRGQPWNQVTLERTLIQRCTTGGEWNGSAIRILNSAIVEVPAATGVFNNGDEDGIYFTTGEYEIRDSLVAWTRDDGIDAGSGGTGTVTVSNTWVEGSYHEGFAWSGGGRVATNQHTVSINCGQGIECGYSTTADSPLVYVMDSLSTANAVGARFGDSYDWTYNGFLRATNSLFLYNARDVWGMNWDDWTYRTNAMDVRGNTLSAPNTHHRDNSIWDPMADAVRLAGFMSTPADAPVGLGLALWNTQLETRQWTNAIPVRLSSFTTRPVSVEYRLETAADLLASGTLTFAPGETVRMILPPSTRPSGREMVRLSLLNPVNAEITGESTAWFIQPALTDVVLVPLGAMWKYLDTGTNAGTHWREPGFDDSGWKQGRAELGYGDEKDGRPEATQLSYGTNSSSKHITYYFRHQFGVENPAEYRQLRLALKRDDGGVVYLNGKEIFRSNMPAGAIDHLTRADDTADDDGTTLFGTNVPPSILVADENVVAVEIHQDSPTSSDISFDLQLAFVPQPRLSADRFGADYILTWSDAEAVLETATELTGPWTVTGLESPAQADVTGPQRFYRLAAPR